MKKWLIITKNVEKGGVKWIKILKKRQNLQKRVKLHIYAKFGQNCPINSLKKWKYYFSTVFFIGSTPQLLASLYSIQN